MAPHGTVSRRTSSCHPQPNDAMPGFRVSHPTSRDHHPMLNVLSWVAGKKMDDDVGDLWRVHDKLYDLTEFIARHPGGKFWLETTRGTDITEAFESAHINPAVEEMLPKYYVKEVVEPRNSPYTFHDDGFYRTLKRKVWPILSNVGTGSTRRMRTMQDAVVVLFLVLVVAAAYIQSYATAMLAGVVLALSTFMAHNWLHQADNFRIYYFDMSALSSYEWRISHHLSHHLFPNTLYDYEITQLEPFIAFLPDPKKSLFVKYTSPVTCHLTVSTVLIVDIVKRIVDVCLKRRPPRTEYLLPLVPVLLMVVCAGQLTTGLSLWATMFCTASFAFGGIGLMLSSGHHHPENYHALDAFRNNPDWGLCQMDTVSDRVEMVGSLFLTSITFGDHTLHHLFPTVDHSKLALLYPALMETCREFDAPYTFVRHMYLVKGMYRQMISSTPNPGKSKYNDKQRKPEPVPTSVANEIKKQSFN